MNNFSDRVNKCFAKYIDQKYQLNYIAQQINKLNTTDFVGKCTEVCASIAVLSSDRFICHSIGNFSHFYIVSNYLNPRMDNAWIVNNDSSMPFEYKDVEFKSSSRVPFGVHFVEGNKHYININNPNRSEVFKKIFDACEDEI